MRLVDVTVENSLPVHLFEAAHLSDVVVLAGPNGVGKTRLLARVVEHLRGGAPTADVRGALEATHPREREAWSGRSRLDLSSTEDMTLFRGLLHRNRRRHKWQSGLVNFESDRTVANIQPFQFQWDIPDPYEEEVDWGVTSGFMRDRFQDTVHTMFRMIESQKQSIANRAVSLRRDGKTSMRLTFSDPMAPFKKVFSQLLGPKTLVDPSARSQRLQYAFEDQVLDFSTLSSGEREVVNIAFDFLLRSPEDCVVFFDEPELHLHPELSYRLIQTLQTIGARNQFFFSTHSPDVITASLDRSVIFLSAPRRGPDDAWVNQAVAVTEDDQTNQALRLLGQSIGIIALGRRIVLIEGTTSSLDKQTYGSITRGEFPSLVLVPTGGKSVIQSFENVYRAVLNRTLWGVDFFMLCDGDAAPAPGMEATSAAEASGRLRVLPRYHLENYFLDEDVWAQAFALMEASDSWLRDPSRIRAEFRQAADSLVSYATALAMAARFRSTVGNVDLMPRDCQGKSVDEIVTMLQARAAAEVERVQGALDTSAMESQSRTFFEVVQQSLRDDSDEWKRLIPGKQLVAMFASRAGVNASRAKTMYINASRDRPEVFADVFAVLRAFETASPG